MAMVNVVMVGRAGTAELAALSLGYAVFMPPVIAGIGCMVGIVATTAREKGAGSAATPEIALRGLRWALVVGGVAWLLLLAAGPLLRLIGHTPELVAGGGAVARMLAPGALFQIVFVAATFYLEGTGRPRPGLVAMAVANVLNLAPRLAADRRPPRPAGDGRRGRGARRDARAPRDGRRACSSGCCACPSSPRCARRRCTLWGPGGWAAGAEMRRIGLAGGAAYFFETVAFAALAQAAGLLGPTPLAAYTILHNIEALVFMVALGLSVAHRGARRPGRRRRRRRRGALRRLRRARDGDGPRRPRRARAARLRAGRRRLLQRRPRRSSPAPRRSSRSSRSRWCSTPARWCSARRPARSATAGSRPAPSSSPSSA